MVSMEFVQDEPITGFCWEKVMNQRAANLWPIALTIVLSRYQRENRSHFDLEQPRGSALMKIPGMSEIREHPLWNEFDMCRVGNLKTPDSHEPICKRMAVCSPGNLCEPCGNLAWECLVTSSWELLGTLLGNLAWEPGLGT